MKNEKTCCYCGSHVVEYQEPGTYYCEFCDMVLDALSLCSDASRRGPAIVEVCFDTHYSKTTPELMLLSTYELLHLLSYARKYRSECWDNLEMSKKLLRSIKKDSFEDKMLIKDATFVVEENYDLYMKATRKMYVFENLLCERLGYIPKRITQNFLRQYEELMEERKDTPMIVSKIKL